MCFQLLPGEAYECEKISSNENHFLELLLLQAMNCSHISSCSSFHIIVTLLCPKSLQVYIWHMSEFKLDKINYFNKIYVLHTRERRLRQTYGRTINTILNNNATTKEDYRWFAINHKYINNESDKTTKNSVFSKLQSTLIRKRKLVQIFEMSDNAGTLNQIHDHRHWISGCKPDRQFSTYHYVP